MRKLMWVVLVACTLSVVGLSACGMDSVSTTTIQATHTSPANKMPNTIPATPITPSIAQPTLYFFTADNCVSCAQVRPVVSGLQETYGSRMAFVEKDFYATANADVVKKYGVRGHPTIIVTDVQGKAIASLSGVVSADELATAIRKVLGDT